MADKFEKDLRDLEMAYYKQLLPSSYEKGERKTMLNIIVEYSPGGYTLNNKEVGLIFHACSTMIRNESFFLLKRDGYKRLSEHAAMVCQKYIPNSSLDENVVRFPVRMDLFNKVIKYFEKDNKIWQIEWITKWELKKVFENNHDLILNVESIGFSDTEIGDFFNTFEQNLKKHFTIF